MKYVSTRGAAPELGFEDVLLSGLAEDGGLYVPAAWPTLDAAAIRDLAGLSYAEAAHRILQPFVSDDIAGDDFAAMIEAAYASFDHAAVAPLSQLGPNLFLLELFHGPTLAFKDIALQLLGRLFDHALRRRGTRMTVVGATSGDTGSAAIEALRDRAAIDVFILHPKGRVSDVQRRQMTTVDAANIRNIAIEGTFDDCQAIVKALFADRAFRTRMNLGAVNSINWARIMAQAVYYFTAAVALGAPHRPIAFSVPTGNFGDVFAGYVAMRMGLPISGLTIATNVNDILARAFATGSYEVQGVTPTSSPAMDIQVSSNFERLMFETCGRDGRQVTQRMASLADTGAFDLGAPSLERMRQTLTARRVDEAGTKATIADIYATTGQLIDPHTAVGIAAARAEPRDRQTPVVCLATAHPAKFPDVVAAAAATPPVPARLSRVFDLPERFETLTNDVDGVKAYISKTAELPAK